MLEDPSYVATNGHGVVCLRRYRFCCTVYSMQTVGRGAQFEVVADGNYVYKTLHTVEKSAAIYRSWGYGLRTRNLEQLAADTLDHARRSLQGVRSMPESHPELAPTLANP